MEKVYPIQEPIINYSDTLFVYKFHEGEIRRHAVTDHTLVYVYSGEMTIVNKAKTTKLYAGDCVFLSRNHNHMADCIGKKKITLCQKETRSSGYDTRFHAVKQIFV